MSNRVSLAELAAADIQLRPSEAVAIVSAICAQHIAGTLPGIPSPGVIRLTRDGDLIAEGPITTGQDTVARAALLLTDLLPGFSALPEYRASGPLRLVIARALGSIDLPPYRSLYEFRAALMRFVTEDVGDVARALFSSWERTTVTRAFNAASRADLTISDVRRARRATGMSLGYLASVAEVPSKRLRDLEWGYMREWPATAEARAQVIRYARAAGLDESIVLSIAWPMIVEHANAEPDISTSTALVLVGPQTLSVIAPAASAAARRNGLRAAILAVAATIALLGAFAFGWRSPTPHPAPAPDALQVGLSGEQPPTAPSRGDGRAVTAAGARAVATHGEDAPPRVVPAATTVSHVEPAAAAAPAKPKRRRPASNRAEPREEPRKAPVLERELFRIVIR
jgi:hypothetical protein